MASLEFYDCLIGKQFWFVFEGKLISPDTVGLHSINLIDSNRICFETKNSKTLFGQEILQIGRINLDERLLSQEKIDTFLRENPETILYNNSDVFSIIKFDYEIKEFPAFRKIKDVLKSTLTPIKETPTVIDEKKTKVGKFEIGIKEYSDGSKFGWFEHEDYGDECSGSLWFEPQPYSKTDQRPNLELPFMLVDFDGVAVLSHDVAAGIGKLGCFVDIEHFCE